MRKWIDENVKGAVSCRGATTVWIRFLTQQIDSQVSHRPANGLLVINSYSVGLSVYTSWAEALKDDCQSTGATLCWPESVQAWACLC